MEDVVIVESKDYAQVVFDDVKECYTENHPLECWFNLNELLKAGPSDTVGIYKVGFVNFKEHVCTQTVSVDSIENHKGKVEFTADQLPKDDGEFYQFVYVSQSKQIRGASIPFQFKRTRMSDYIEVEESNEAVLIQSKETAINEAISEFKTRCANLTAANNTYEKLVQENEELIKVLKEEVSNVKMRCMKLNLDNDKLNFAVKLKSENLRDVTTQLVSLNDENTKLQNKFDDLANENKNLQDSLKNRIDQINQLKGDLEDVKMDQITNLEKQVDEKVDELTRIKDELKRNEALVSEQAITIQNILIEKDTLNCFIQKLTKEKIQLECSQENLSQELNMSKDKLQAAEQCKEMLRAQLVVLTDELNSANSKLDIHLTTIRKHETNEETYKHEKESLVQKIEKIKIEYESKLEESSGSYFALKLAHVHLESKLKSTEQSRSKIEKENESQKQSLTKLKSENQELRERIQAGSKEYSKLFEKYRLIKNQQFNYDMNLYHDLNGSDILIPKDQRSTRFNNNTRQPSFLGTSTPNVNSESDIETDSAIQDKTLSQSQSTQTPNAARASSADIENTLLDALLGSSFGWNNNNNVTNNNKQSDNASTSSKQPVATTTQPKMTLSSKQSPIENINLNENKTINDLNENILIQSNKLMKCKPIDFRLKPEITKSNLKDEDDNVFADIENTEHFYIPGSDNMEAQNLNNQNTNMIDALNIKNCDICNYIFPTDANINDIERHYSVHYGPSCPVCFMLFRKGYPQDKFEEHVNSHFLN